MDDPNDFGDFIRAYSGWRKTGKNGATVLFSDPASEDDTEHGNNPIRILYDAVEKASKTPEHSDWLLLLKGGEGKSAILPKPTRLTFVQALIYELGRDGIYEVPVGLGPKDLMPLMVLSMSPGLALVHQMTGVYGPSDDLVVGGHVQEGTYKLTYDPIAINAGVFFRLFPVGHDPRNSGRTVRGQTVESTQIGHQAYFTKEIKEFNGRTPCLTDHEELLKERVKPWDEVLCFHSYEKQAEIISGCVPPELLFYAWADHPEYLSIAKSMHSGKVTSVPEGTEFRNAADRGRTEANRRPDAGASAGPESVSSVPDRTKGPAAPEAGPISAPPFRPGSHVNTGDPAAVAAAAAAVVPGVDQDKKDAGRSALEAARARLRPKG